MKLYQLTYTAQVAAKEEEGFQSLSTIIEYAINKAYLGNIFVDNSKAELENDNEIIVS
jgi:hypothetical protein